MPRVIGGFKCLYTNKIYHVGDIYDGDRLEEYQAKGYVEKSIAAPQKGKKTKGDTSGD